MISLNKIVLLVTLLLSSFGFDFVFSTNLDPNEMMMPKMGEQKQQEPSGGSRGEWLPSRNEGGEFRLKIGARDEFCFHEYFDLKETSNIKYNIIIRVLKGGRSKDIDINVYTPKSTHIIKEKRKQSYSGALEISEGDWRFCLNNKFSSVSAKIIFFSLRPAETESLRKQAKKVVPTVLTYSDAALEQINTNMHIVQSHQVESRLKMASHWYHVQGLNERVSNYSIVELLVMCASPIVQVTLLRRLFSYRYTKRYTSNGAAVNPQA
ncbi:transmembrane emp24 domain-containing protein 5-like [Symsagittifera roscoffensis]|uniref:transmembrane emp24 domain-containing protein 5-like n=1 Tax=Symsagittifera roscoffensis TaxID=84072 RepID=UPI00307BB5AA